MQGGKAFRIRHGLALHLEILLIVRLIRPNRAVIQCGRGEAAFARPLRDVEQRIKPDALLKQRPHPLDERFILDHAEDTVILRHADIPAAQRIRRLIGVDVIKGIEIVLPIHRDAVSKQLDLRGIERIRQLPAFAVHLKEVSIRIIKSGFLQGFLRQIIDGGIGRAPGLLDAHAHGFRVAVGGKQAVQGVMHHGIVGGNEDQEGVLVGGIVGVEPHRRLRAVEVIAAQIVYPLRVDDRLRQDRLIGRILRTGGEIDVPQHLALGVGNVQPRLAHRDEVGIALGAAPRKAGEIPLQRGHKRLRLLRREAGKARNLRLYGSFQRVHLRDHPIGAIVYQQRNRRLQRVVRVLHHI